MPRRHAQYSFTRYLATKKSLDDRSLNRQVWDTLARRMAERKGEAPLRVLEVGCGIGTMVERLMDWGLWTAAVYTAIDAEPGNLVAARERLRRYAAEKGLEVVSQEPGALFLQDERQSLLLALEAVELFDFIHQEQGRSTWDLLVAHAFLDLVDLPAALPRLLSLLRPGGLFYFTLNFDGATILEPQIDPELDRRLETLYHRTMDERLVQGRPAGDSLTGRHLFAHLRRSGAKLLSAGSSDWVVFPGPQGYTSDEAYFLHFILHTFHQALRGRPELPEHELDAWIEARHAQVERGELIYIAHQLDFVGQVGKE
jgi:SAM-dependent methyltransferase